MCVLYTPHTSFVVVVLMVFFFFVFRFLFFTRSSVSLSSKDPIVRPETKLVESQQDGCCQGDVCLTESICSCPCARGACLGMTCTLARSLCWAQSKPAWQGKKKKIKTWHAWNHVTSHSGLTVVHVCHALQWVRAGDLSVWIWCYTCCWDERCWCCCCEHEISVVTYLCVCSVPEERKKKDKTEEK